MKIALIGTHGTGKTTLAHKLVGELKERGIDSGFVREIAGICPLPINENTTREAQKWMIFQQYCKELEEGERFDSLVCDRSTLDYYVYYYNKFGKNKLLEDFVKGTIKEYDFLFRIPLNKDYLKKDKIRSTNPQFQKEIDKKFDYLSKKLSIKYHTINNLKEMLQIISPGITRCLYFSQQQANKIFKEMKKNGRTI